MAEHGRISVILNGQKIQTVNQVSLNQEIFEHHDFEVTVPLNTLVKVQDDEDPFPVLKDVIGKDIEIKFGIASSNDEEGQNESTNFIGIVKTVKIFGKSWEHSSVAIRGNSPTILIDGIETSRAFADKGLADIYDQCVSDHLSSKIKLIDNLTYTGKLPFTVQWNETEFDFIGRLCQTFGEWLYFDGEALCLGHNDSSQPVTLPKNRVRSLQFDYSVVPGVPGVVFRDYQKNEVKQVNPPKLNGSDDMASFAISESKDLYSGEGAVFAKVPSYASGDKMQHEEDQINHLLKAKKASQNASVLVVNGETDNAAIKLGGTIRLEGFNHSGDFIVISLTHTCIDAKSYSNQFVAIPKGSAFPKRMKFKTISAESCIAVVSDNQDPNKSGRVRVKFDWFQDVESPWIRQLTGHAGDKRGMYFTPEIGDEVMVGFEHGDARFPYVLGSVYNGKNFNEAAYNADNNFKVIRTRSGNEILFDDSGKMVFKNNHNTIEMNCAEDGSISIRTDGNIEIEAKKNLKIAAGEELVIQSGKNTAINVGQNLQVNVGKTADINSAKDMTIKSDAKLKAAGKDIEIAAQKSGKMSSMTTKIEGQTTAELSSGATTTVKGGMVKIN